MNTYYDSGLITLGISEGSSRQNDHALKLSAPTAARYNPLTIVYYVTESYLILTVKLPYMIKENFNRLTINWFISCPSTQQ